MHGRARARCVCVWDHAPGAVLARPAACHATCSKHVCAARPFFMAHALLPADPHSTAWHAATCFACLSLRAWPCLVTWLSIMHPYGLQLNGVHTATAMDFASLVSALVCRHVFVLRTRSYAGCSSLRCLCMHICICQRTPSPLEPGAFPYAMLCYGWSPRRHAQARDGRARIASAPIAERSMLISLPATRILAFQCQMTGA